MSAEGQLREPLRLAVWPGMNGVLVGMAPASGLPGGGLRGEIPHVFSQIPLPRLVQRT